MSLPGPARRRVETWAPWAAGGLLACPVLVAYYPPMTDLPYHEAAIGILRRFDDVAMFPPGLYERNLGEPNQLFHLLAWGLSYLVSTRWAVKLAVAGVVLAIPVCAARFARHAGASPLAALVVAPMALGWLFSWGLVANLLGLAAFLAVMPALDDLAREPHARGALRCAGAALLLYFAHEAVLFAFAGAALGLALAHPISKRATLLRLVPFAASAVIAAAQAWWQGRYTAPLFRDIPRVWDSPWHKLEEIPGMVVPAADGVVAAGMSGLCALTIACFFWLRARERRELASSQPAPAADAARPGRARAWALRYRWELFVLASIAAYFAFPLTLNGATMVYQRWFPPGFAVLALAAAPRDLWARPARVARVALAILPVATLLVAGPSFADSDREYRALDEIVGRVDQGSSVASIDLGPRDPARTFTTGTAGGRILATRGGRLAFAFTSSSVSPVFMVARYQWNESIARLGEDPWAFSIPDDFHRFRYLLLHTTDARLARTAVRGVRAEAAYIATAGDWLLFESRLPTLPLLSEDVDASGVPQETLADRIHAILPGELAAGAARWPSPGGRELTE